MNNKNQIKKIESKVLNIKTQIPAKIATMLFIIVTIYISSCNQNRTKAELPETPNSEQIFNDLKINNVENWDNDFDISELKTFKEDYKENPSEIIILDKNIENTNTGYYEAELKLKIEHSHDYRASYGYAYITAIYQLVDNNWKFNSAIKTSYECISTEYIPPPESSDNENENKPEKKVETKKLPTCEWCGQEISGNIYHPWISGESCKCSSGQDDGGRSYHQKCAEEKCENYLLKIKRNH